MIRYLRQWRRDWYYVFTNELRMIFCDSGVMVIFFLAGLAYPLIYGIVYGNGTVDDTPVAVVDLSHSTESRRFIRKMDATREISIAYTCTDMEEAARLMRETGPYLHLCGHEQFPLLQESADGSQSRNAQ